MQFRETALDGCLEVLPRAARDARGRFVKTFHAEIFAAHGLASRFDEQYHSTSLRHVIRGLHFQLPPADHAKLVYCVSGSVWDVAVDLRPGSATERQHTSLVLSAEVANAFYLPRGVAHGFCTPDEAATLVYMVETVHSPEHDAGVRWDSAGIAWPVADPILSERDRMLPALAELDSPFPG